MNKCKRILGKGETGHEENTRVGPDRQPTKPLTPSNPQSPQKK